MQWLEQVGRGYGVAEHVDAPGCAGETRQPDPRGRRGNTRPARASR